VNVILVEVIKSDNWKSRSLFSDILFDWPQGSDQGSAHSKKILDQIDGPAEKIGSDRWTFQKQWIGSVGSPKKLDQIGRVPEKIGSDRFFVKSCLKYTFKKKKAIFCRNKCKIYLTELNISNCTLSHKFELILRL
jgi:hypothetical protein